MNIDMEILHTQEAEYRKILLAEMYIFPSENKNLLKT